MQLFSLAILTAAGLTLANPNGVPDTSKRFTTSVVTSSGPDLAKRFPGCIDQNGNDASCTCSCAGGYHGIFTDPIEQGAYADCQQNGGSYQYGPVGCAAAPTNDGEVICSAKGCYWKQAAGGGPAGCFCCTTNC
ncbi:hypothetical protein J7T55_014524 [Diaporthe amygdali]|uniref:uncharacterized protein n=1 Tax=Phomopsis amygdali TaxID=1214568 RepID=UPI0022FE339E|nr:uncharacterized protein J7T55_014524 [Diaporthe amygdali]KAJ0118071.1 hypothetical protein J7T55_014524 [Diaporthe amygdali]